MRHSQDYCKHLREKSLKQQLTLTIIPRLSILDVCGDTGNAANTHLVVLILLRDLRVYIVGMCSNKSLSLITILLVNCTHTRNIKLTKSTGQETHFGRCDFPIFE